MSQITGKMSDAGFEWFSLPILKPRSLVLFCGDIIKALKILVHGFTIAKYRAIFYTLGEDGICRWGISLTYKLKQFCTPGVKKLVLQK